MSTHGFRRPIQGYTRDTLRRKRVLAFDLNDAPSGEIRSNSDENIEHRLGRMAPMAPVAPMAPPAASVPLATTIDVEAIDDEVVISSPRSFAEARNNSRRNYGATTVLVDEDSDVRQGHREEPITRLTLNSYKKRRRVPPNQTIINCECYINLEGSYYAKRITKPSEQPPSVQPPKEPPTFSCPVCMGTLVEETSTKCGHIFCKACIETAIGAQSKCPTCRRKLKLKDIIRIYLPAAC